MHKLKVSKLYNNSTNFHTNLSPPVFLSSYMPTNFPTPNPTLVHTGSKIPLPTKPPTVSASVIPTPSQLPQQTVNPSTNHTP